MNFVDAHLPIGDEIRACLRRLGWTQETFAEVIDASTRTANQLVNGKRGITPAMAHKLGAAFGTTATYWLGLESTAKLLRVP